MSNLKTHIQAKHEGVKYACNQCDYQATQQAHLTTHIQAKHEDVIYACNQCVKLEDWKISQLTFSLNMKVSSMLVTSVTIKLHSKVV